ncbi:TPA: RHS repeat protein [Escherichia coli]|nr:RHS repeat protein [Escherichia coli]
MMGREHHTEYSGHDLPVKMRGPGAEGFSYDRHGNLLAWTDGNGVVWTMEYGPFDLPWRERTVKATAGSTATIKTRCN